MNLPLFASTIVPFCCRYLWMLPVHIVPPQQQHRCVVSTFSHFWKPTKISLRNVNERRTIVICNIFIMQWNFQKIYKRPVSSCRSLTLTTFKGRWKQKGIKGIKALRKKPQCITKPYITDEVRQSKEKAPYQLSEYWFLIPCFVSFITQLVVQCSFSLSSSWGLFFSGKSPLEISSEYIKLSICLHSEDRKNSGFLFWYLNVTLWVIVTVHQNSLCSETVFYTYSWVYFRFLWRN